MPQPLIKRKIVKKRTKKVARFQSDRFLRVKVTSPSMTESVSSETQTLLILFIYLFILTFTSWHFFMLLVDLMEEASRY